MKDIKIEATMGSVIDYIVCPNCGNPQTTWEYYYKTNEEYALCSECGYYRAIEIKQDSRKKRFDELTDEDWDIDEIKNPYGSYKIKHKNSEVYGYGSISSKEHYDAIISNLDEVEEFALSRFINGKIVTVDVLRKLKLEKLRKVMRNEQG